MGVWGFGLYGNDDACDIKENYMHILEETESYEKAYEKIEELFHEYIGTALEPIYWYVIADFQWHSGVLLQDVKENALEWIKRKGGMDLWEDRKGKQKWQATLEKLEQQFISSMPAVKKIRKRKKFITNPWNIGDVYAYQFRSEESKSLGLYGKYIAMQKISEEFFFDDVCSRIQVFDKIFESIPTITDLDGINIFPFDNIERYANCKNYNTFSLTENFEIGDQILFPLDLNVVMIRYRMKDYQNQYFHFVGNIDNNYNYPMHDHSECYWDELESDFCFYYSQWKEYNYEIFNDRFYLCPKSK